MRNKFDSIFLVAVCIFFLGTASAQDNSLNTFSPYSFYGIGDIKQIGTTAQRAMGGVGVAYRSYFNFNPQNPASYSAVPRNSFIFNAAVENQGISAKSSGVKTSHNTANLRDLGFVFPLYKGIGMGFSLTPLSSVGYKTNMIDDSNLVDLGLIKKNYYGEGGLAELKLGVGAEFFHRLSLGVNMIVYKGNIENYFTSSITSIIGSTNYRQTTAIYKQNLSKLLYSVGVQYNILQNENRVLTFGATYQPKTTVKSSGMTQIVSINNVSSNEQNLVSMVNDKRIITIPALMNFGFFFQNKKIGAGLDYSLQNWKGAMQSYVTADGQKVDFDAMQNYKFGMSYTPNKQDVRNYFKRWTYRAGVRYSQSYISKGGMTRDEKAISLGATLPVNYSGLSSANISVEFGTRGKAIKSQVRENFINVSLGFTIFGEDGWFLKYKYR